MSEQIVLTGHASTIYAHLRDNGPSYGHKISKTLGISSGRVSITLRQLEKRGLLVSARSAETDSMAGSPRVQFDLADRTVDVHTEPAAYPSVKAARYIHQGKRVTLRGLSQHYDADSIEALVRTAAEIVGGGEDRGSLSSRQVELAKDAYQRLMAEFDDDSDGPNVNGSEADEEFYAALRDHAHDYGPQATWTAVYGRFRSGDLVMAEANLLAFLGALLSDNHSCYDPVSALGRRPAIVTGRVNSLVDGELFSVDGGESWHAYRKPWGQKVSCYLGARQGGKPATYQVKADLAGECLVVRRA